MNIYEYTQGQITAYPSRSIELYNTRQFNQYDLLNQIAAYTDSHYTTGQFDDLGRRKPFHNISNRILHKQRTAEDIDTRDIQLSTKTPELYTKSMLMTVANRKWMKEVNFAHTLNEMTESRGRDGGLLIKKVIKDGQLNIEVADLLNTITDPTDIFSGVKISEMRYNAAELVAMKANGWENVEQAIQMHESSNANDDNNDTGESTDYITVYVIDGVLPRTMKDEDAEPYSYTRQMHVITLFTSTNDDGDDEQSGVTLYCSENVNDNYKYLAYEKVSGRSLGRGMVEQSFQAQMGINEAVINEKNTMDISSKVILQSPNGNGLEANNILTDMHDGAILDYNVAPISLLNTTPNSLSYNRTIVDGWNSQANDQTSVQDVNTGNMPASATFRGMALQNQEANSIFELRREEMGNFIKEIYTDWVIPYLKKWVKSKDFLESDLSSEEFKQVREDWTYNKSMQIVTDRLLAGDYDEVPAEELWSTIGLDTELEKQRLVEETKGRNWFKMPKDYLDGIEFDLDILITDEQQLKQVFLSNQIDILNTYLANRDAFMQDPNAMKQYNAIQQTMGLSPLDNFEQEVEQSQEPTQPVEITSNQEA